MGLVQVKGGTAASATALNITLDNPTGGPGHSLVVVISTQDGAVNPTVSAVTLGGSADNFGGSAVATSGNTGTAFFESAWADLNCATGQTAIAITATGGSGSPPIITAWVYEFDDLVTASAFDKSSANAAAGTSWTSNNTATLSQPLEVAVGISSVFAGSAPTLTGPSSPWSNQTQITSGVSSYISGYNLLNSTSAIAYAGSASSATDGGVLIVTFKRSAGSVIQPLPQRTRWGYRRSRRHRQPIIIPVQASTGDALVTPDTVQATTTIPTPTASAGSTATPSTVNAVTSVGTATPSAGSTATPGVVQAITSIPAPTPSASSTATPSTVSGSTSISGTASASSTATPGTVNAVTSIPTPTISGSGSATATPSTVQATTSIPAPTVSASSTASPSTVQLTTTVPAPSPSAGSKVLAAVVNAVTSIGSALASASSKATPAVVSAITAIGTASPSSGSKATPGTVNAVTTIPAPSVGGTQNATATPSTVQASTSIATPTASSSSKATPNVVSASTTVNTPAVKTSTLVQVLTVLASAVIPIPVIPSQVTYGTTDVSGHELGGSAGSSLAPDNYPDEGQAPDTTTSGRQLG